MKGLKAMLYEQGLGRVVMFGPELMNCLTEVVQSRA